MKERKASNGLGLREAESSRCHLRNLLYTLREYERTPMS